MRIYFTDGQDPMLLDSLDGMGALHERLQRFAGSDEPALSLAADQSGTPAPYAELLAGLKIRKSAGPIQAKDSMSLIIEVDSDWIEELRGEAEGE